jgi:hypothetical protein
MNYAKNLARDTGNQAMQDFAVPYVSTSRIVSTNAVASSVISLNPNTTVLEIGTFGGQGAVIRWIPRTETAAVAPRASVVASGLGANFDHYIPSEKVRRFVVPRETTGTFSGQVGSVNGLFYRLALINAGITASSVLVSEF